MKTYSALVSREGKWWMVHIPELNGLTQARRLADAGLMAREWIAVNLDLDLEDVEVTVSVADIDGIPVAASLETIQSERKQAAELEREASERAAALAKSLAAKDIPVRDIGAAMGVSFQRAHQLVNS